MNQSLRLYRISWAEAVVITDPHGVCLCIRNSSKRFEAGVAMWADCAADVAEADVPLKPINGLLLAQQYIIMRCQPLLISMQQLIRVNI